VSHDPSEITLIWGFAAQEVINSSAASYCCGNRDQFNAFLLNNIYFSNGFVYRQTDKCLSDSPVGIDVHDNTCLCVCVCVSNELCMSSTEVCVCEREMAAVFLAYPP